MARELLSKPVKHWSIYRDTNAVGAPCLVVVRHASTVGVGFSGSRYMREVIDYPILYPSGVIAYDNPRMIPVRVQSAVKAAMKRLKAAMEAEGFKFAKGDSYGYPVDANGVRNYNANAARHYYGANWYTWACEELRKVGLYEVPTGEMTRTSPTWYGEMSIPRPVMYKFGHGHLVETLPADVFTDIVDLFCDSEPARERFEAWLKDNGVRLEPFGDAVRPIVEAVNG